MGADHGVVGWLFAFAAAGWAIVSYFHNKSVEYKKTFNDRQLDVVLATAQAVGKLVGASNEDEWKGACATFWELYWGRLVIFEDDTVAGAMVELGRKLNATSFDARKSLAKECYRVSRVLRDFLASKNEEGWKISFATLHVSKT